MTSTKTLFLFMFVALFALVSAKEDLDQGSMRLRVRYTSPALLTRVGRERSKHLPSMRRPRLLVCFSLHYMQGTTKGSRGL
jgi:hypothetical protein